MEISLIIPCYNEAKNLPILFKKLENLLNNEKIQLIIVENGSEDNSLSIIKSFHEKNKNFKFISLRTNRGYGYGILQGLKIAEKNYIGWTHADLQTDPLDIEKASKFLIKNDEKIFIKGLRNGRKISDNFFTICMSLIASLRLGIFLWDINAQPSIFPASFMKKWNEPPYNFSLDLYVYFLAKKNNLKIKRFPVKFKKRKFGVSKWNINFSSKLEFIKSNINYINYLSRKY